MSRSMIKQYSAIYKEGGVTIQLPAGAKIVHAEWLESVRGRAEDRLQIYAEVDPHCGAWVDYEFLVVKCNEEFYNDSYEFLGLAESDSCISRFVYYGVANRIRIHARSDQ